MNAENERLPWDQDSDYDGAWKEALRRHLPEFLQKFFPDLFALIDWTIEPQWLDKEVSQVLGQPGRRNRQVDVLFKVGLRNGEWQWILFHLEIQSAFEKNFTFRLAHYNAGLLWTFQQRVLTLVILGDLREDWAPKWTGSNSVRSRRGCGSRSASWSGSWRWSGVKTSRCR